MYKALNLVTLEEIILLQRRWQADLAHLRKLDRNDQLVCPGCQQPVRIRAGMFRRWHFAHKHLENCPYARQSPELLKSRAVLYDWLVGQLGEAAVTVEKQFPNLPRPVDICAMLQGQEIVYWIHDLRLSPALRQLLVTNLETTARRTYYIFNRNMLREDEHQPYWIHLTTTERDFMRQSVLDLTAQQAGETVGKTLHYLDNEQKVLITYRRLKLQHPPQRYSGRKMECELRFASILPESGEILHPEEIPQLPRQQHRAEAARIRLEKQEKFYQSVIEKSKEADINPGIRGMNEFPSDIVDQPTLSYAHPFRRTGKCIYCAKETDDWVSYNGKTGECVCRDCQAAPSR